MRQTVFRDLARSRRRGSSTRPTASASAAGCSRPTGADGVLTRGRSATACSTIRKAARLERNRRRSDLRRTATPRCGAATRRGWQAHPAPPDRHRDRSDRAVRRPHQAHPRIQAPAAQHPGNHRALSGDPGGAGRADWPPRVKIFAGKAAGSYQRAKLIIKLATMSAAWSSTRPVVGDRLKMVFLPNYSVSARRKHHSARPTFPSRSRPPAWKPPAPAT